MTLEEYKMPAFTGENTLQPISCKDPVPLPAGDETASFTIHGNCMEGSKIYDGDTVLVDFDRFPRIGDTCICSDGKNKLLIKRYEGRVGKRVFSVGTNYDFGGRSIGPNGEWNRGLWTDKIYGVVFASISADGLLRWQFDPLTLSKEPGEILPQRGNVRFVEIC